MRSDRNPRRSILIPALFALSACATAPSGRHPAPEPPARCIPGTVLLVYQSNLLGEILPCG